MIVDRYKYAEQFDDIDLLCNRIRTILLRGEYDRSPEGVEFERRFARFVNTAYAKAVGCGTDALILTLRALDIGRGDEVITQANTFYATAAAIAVAGATPVLIDADPRSFLMDASQLESAITPRTRAIIVVHLYGKPTPMERILEIAARHDLLVIEDAAQAHGASIDGRNVGTFGIAGCFSFHPSKNLAAAGDAGCVVTNSDALATLIEAHRTHGQLVQHEHIVLGVNSKIDALQAVVLLTKLDHVHEWNRARGNIAERYRAALRHLDLAFQSTDEHEVHAYHLFQIRSPQRDALLAHLRERGIDAVVRYPYPIHLQPPFARYGWSAGQFPVAEALANELLCLPIRPGMTDFEISYVCEAIHGFFGARVA